MSYRQNKQKKEIVALMRNVLCAVYHFERYKEKYYGITYELYYALTLINNAKRLTISSIAEAMMIPLHKATRIIQRLHSRRLVQRKISERDKRVVYVSLTKKGREFLTGIENFCYATVMSNAASLSDDELSKLIHVATHIPDILRIQQSTKMR